MFRSVTAIVLALSCFASPLFSSSFSEEAWQENQDIYGEILRHPFLLGLQDGTLDEEIFAYYLMQDAEYLAAFASALKATAAKAPNEEWKTLLNTHADQSIAAEKELHESLLSEHGISLQKLKAIELNPDAFAYTSFLLATAHSGSFAESMAALLPCYWIYWEVGRELQKRGSPDASYQKWITSYSSESYGKTVQQVKDIVDELAEQALSSEVLTMKAHFARASRYEWMLWDGAYHQRSWPPVARP